MSARYVKRVGFAAAAALLLLLAKGASAAVGFGATINVTTANDEFGTGAACSLREAVQTANTNADFGGCTHTGNFATGPNSDVINLPAADPGYALARTGAEDDTNVLGDLDITSNITIQGAGAGTTPIFVCAGCPERVIEVVSGTNVDIKDVTLKLGHPGGDGGGLFNGANASTTLTRVTIGLNSPGGNGGGIYNQGTLVVDASAIANNEVTGDDGGGGGIYNATGATLTLNDSRVLANTATRNATGGASFGGGGIYNSTGTLALDNSTVDGNVATTQGAALAAFTDGGGILTFGNLTLTKSTISNNTNSGNDADGGGIACSGDTSVVLIDRTLVSGNTAATNPDLSLDSPSGGGIFCSAAQLTIVDSLIRDNKSESGFGGGGLLLVDGVVKIVNTTISANIAVGEVLKSAPGGGIFAGQSVSSLELVNSTLSGNSAGGPGGGLFIQLLGSPAGQVRASLSNVTIAGNTATGSGGGIFVADDSGDSEVVIRNSVLSGNVDSGSGDHDDCDGPLTSDGNNLVKNATGCVITGITAGNQIGVDAKLGALLDNGGPLVGATNASSLPEPLPTRLPANDSPLVDRGFANGCKDQAGFDLPSDQRGEPRPVDGPDANATVTCDLGAVELQDALFKDSYE